MKQIKTIGLISVGQPYFDVEVAEKNLRNTRHLLEKEWRVIGPDFLVTDGEHLAAALKAFSEEPELETVIVQTGTFPDGEAPLKIAEKLRIPLIIHSLPEPEINKKIAINSLCGANLTTFTLKALSHPHTYIHGDPNEKETGGRLFSKVRAILSLNELKQTRLALIGFRAPGFYPSGFNELLLRRSLGLAMDYIDLGEVKRAFSSQKRRAAPVKDFPVIGGGTLTSAAVGMMEQHYAALTQVFENSGTNVFAIRDWPELFDVDAPGGMWPALGWLQDDGFLIGPEGDVNAAVTMKLGRPLSCAVPFFADISGWQDSDSSLILWHYGAAPSLANPRTSIQFGSEGREVQFTLKPGKATLMRVGMTQDTFRLLGIAGQVMDKPIQIGRAGAYFQTTRTPAGQVIDHILDNGWEHHYILFYGDLTEELKTISKLTGFQLTLL